MPAARHVVELVDVEAEDAVGREMDRDEDGRGASVKKGHCWSELRAGAGGHAERPSPLCCATVRPRQSASATRSLVDCGVVMAPLFIGTALVEGSRRIDYSVLRHPVSALALGDFGWIQVANFLAGGTLTCLFAIGLRRAAPVSGSTGVPLLLGAAGLGLVGAGIFATDPVNGYPPGAPDRTILRTRRGAVHELCAVPVMLGIPVAAAASGVRLRQTWRASMGGILLRDCARIALRVLRLGRRIRWRRPVRIASRSLSTRWDHHCVRMDQCARPPCPAPIVIGFPDRADDAH